MEYSYELIKLREDLPIKMITHTSDNQAFIPRHWHESVEISYVLSGKIDQNKQPQAPAFMYGVR